MVRVSVTAILEEFVCLPITADGTPTAALSITAASPNLAATWTAASAAATATATLAAATATATTIATWRSGSIATSSASQHLLVFSGFGHGNLGVQRRPIEHKLACQDAFRHCLVGKGHKAKPARAPFTRHPCQRTNQQRPCTRRTASTTHHEETRAELAELLHVLAKVTLGGVA